MISWFSDFLNFIYPEVCAACNNGLFKGERVICTQCHYHLPQTGFHALANNHVERQFWGKVPIYSATSLFYFNKGERVQHLIHRLKYHGEKEVGVFTGKMMASMLLKTPRFSTLNAVIPVPLHAKKLKIRGFNQSDFFGQGIAEGMNIPLLRNYLIRTKATSTQTRKSRFDRYENVNQVFGINPENNISPGHFLLVDDVITTGSTLVACAEALNSVKGVKVSIATIAYAKL